MLPVSFFQRPTDVVARELIGRILVSCIGAHRTVGRIVETEAYLGHRDPASHGFAHRRHARNENLFAPAGTWYVYLSYGMHWCANLVCERETNAGAVLLRALEPAGGAGDHARAGAPRWCATGCSRRAPGASPRPSVSTAHSTASPCAGATSCILARDPVDVTVEVSRRIGITKAVDWPLRFTAKGSRWASR